MAEAVAKAVPARRTKRPSKAAAKVSSWSVAVQRVKPLTKQLWVFLSIIILLGGTEVTLYLNPTAGVYANAIAFVALVGIALWQERARQLAIAAAILPVATMVTLSLPQTTIFAQTMVFYDTLLLIAFIYRFMFTLDYPVRLTRLGVKGYARLLPFMIVAGEVLGVIGYGMLRHHFVFSGVPLGLVASTAVVMAITEETFFRGLIQQRGSLVLHPGMAAALSALLYAATTFDHTTLLAPLFALIAGTVLSITYYKKQNLVLTTTINVLTKLTYLGLLATYVIH